MSNESEHPMDYEHPFVQWWINESRWHRVGEHWKSSLACTEGNLAMTAWNAAVRECITSDKVYLQHLMIPEKT